MDTGLAPQQQQTEKNMSNYEIHNTNSVPSLIGIYEGADCQAAIDQMLENNPDLWGQDEADFSAVPIAPELGPVDAKEIVDI